MVVLLVVGRLNHMHVFPLIQRLNVLPWKITLDLEYQTQLGYLKTNKSRCMESLTILKQICQPWCSPLFYRILGHNKHRSVCVYVRVRDRESALGLAAQGACLNRLWQTLTVMMWPEGPWLPCTHTCTQTRIHVNTLTHTKLPAPGVLPTVTPDSNIIISPPGWFGGIRGLQREREGEKRPDLIPSCLETWLSWGRLFFGMQQTLWDPPPLPLFPSPHRPAAAALLFGLPTSTGIYCSLHHTGCLTVVWSLGQNDWNKHDT